MVQHVHDFGALIRLLWDTRGIQAHSERPNCSFCDEDIFQRMNWCVDGPHIYLFEHI